MKLTKRLLRLIYQVCWEFHKDKDHPDSHEGCTGCEYYRRKLRKQLDEPKLRWRLGTQHELCDCTECHDQCCHHHLWTAFSPADRLICRVNGHTPSNRISNIVACKRRCGYVLEVLLPRATTKIER